jgi:hypothetical protein
MSNILAHYSPEDVSVLLGGFHNLSGFADGTFLSISKANPVYTTRESSDGAISRTYKNSQVYNLSLTLHQASESNQILSYMSKLDELTQMGKFPFLVKDNLGSTLFFSLTSWIETMPDSSFSTSIETREWVIKCSQATFNLGGNESASSVGEDFLNGALGLAPGLSRLF